MKTLAFKMNPGETEEEYIDRVAGIVGDAIEEVGADPSTAVFTDHGMSAPEGGSLRITPVAIRFTDDVVDLTKKED